MVLRCNTVVTGYECEDVDGIDGGRRIATVTGGTETEVEFDVERTVLGLTLASAGYLVGLVSG